MHTENALNSTEMDHASIAKLRQELCKHAWPV